MTTREFEALPPSAMPWAQGLSHARVGPARETTCASEDPRIARDGSHPSTSQALATLRGVAILFVVAMHATMPYMAFVKAPSADFAQLPYSWLAFPIVDSRRWLGFDIFAAWIDVYLMSLMFFLSGLFVNSSLVSKGSRAFLAMRGMRLGAPFVFALFVVMPVALYPAYQVRSLNPTLLGYIKAYLSLPFWPNGPMWFLWMLLAMTFVVAALHQVAPRGGELLRRLSSDAAKFPGRYFLGLATTATLAYVPLAFAFSPWDWRQWGPFTFQVSRPTLYLVYYLAGYGVGAHGLAKGLLATNGRLAANWLRWSFGAIASLLLWMGLTGLTLTYSTSAPSALHVLAEVVYAWAGAASIFFVLAASLRLRAYRSVVLGALSHNAFGIYLLHYAPLVWLQYEMLDVSLPAVLKALIVFTGTLLAAFAGTLVLRGALQRSRRMGTYMRMFGQRTPPIAADTLMTGHRSSLTACKPGTMTIVQAP